MSYTKKEMRRIVHQSNMLQGLGFSEDEADSLRRISRKLQHWFEHECNGTIERDDSGIPHRVWWTFKGERRAYKCSDLERGAMKRLDVIMELHPDFVPYIQTDPRGASLYLIPKAKLAESPYSVDCIYSSIGVCVY
jgi:hypothetical protein